MEIFKLPPHYTDAAQEFLNEQFPGGSEEWPARPGHLTLIPWIGE